MDRGVSNRSTLTTDRPLLAMSERYTPNCLVLIGGSIGVMLLIAFFVVRGGFNKTLTNWRIISSHVAGDALTVAFQREIEWYKPPGILDFGHNKTLHEQVDTWLVTWDLHEAGNSKRLAPISICGPSKYVERPNDNGPSNITGLNLEQFGTHALSKDRVLIEGPTLGLAAVQQDGSRLLVDHPLLRGHSRMALSRSRWHCADVADKVVIYDTDKLIGTPVGVSGPEFEKVRTLLRGRGGRCYLSDDLRFIVVVPASGGDRSDEFGWMDRESKTNGRGHLDVPGARLCIEDFESLDGFPQFLVRTDDQILVMDEASQVLHRIKAVPSDLLYPEAWDPQCNLLYYIAPKRFSAVPSPVLTLRKFDYVTGRSIKVELSVEGVK